jgi:hypothetical protein
MARKIRSNKRSIKKTQSKRFIAKSLKQRKSKLLKNRLSLRNSIIKNLKGGSPASNHVIGSLAKDCVAQNITPLTPESNLNLSNVHTWNTTGGGRKRRKNKSKKSKRTRKSRKN